MDQPLVPGWLKAQPLLAGNSTEPLPRWALGGGGDPASLPSARMGMKLPHMTAALCSSNNQPDQSLLWGRATGYTFEA